MTDTEQILKLIEDNKLEEAQSLCQPLLENNHLTIESLDVLGLLYIKLQDFAQAAFYFEKALALNPDQVEQHINLGNIYVSMGQLDKAKQHLQQALRIDPHHAVGYNNLGRLFYLENLFAKAIPYFEKALRLNPDYWEAHYNLAHCLAQKNQFQAAAVHYREVLRLMPEHHNAHYNLGLIYFEEGNYEAAIEHLKASLTTTEVSEDPAAPLYYIAHSHLALGHIAEATEYFEKSLNFSNPDTLGESHHNLAVLYLRQENYLKALFQFEEALKHQPENHTAKHMVNALTGVQSETPAPNQYISDLFDQYAEHYNAHVKEKLHYNVPGQLRNAVGRCISANSSAGRVLDLGCGTGLCGVYFRDLAIELIGVDLSPKMVEKAKALDAYESVIVADIQDYLNDPKLKPFNLIIAGDVLVYSGNLTKLFQAVTAALLPKGRFAFTIENLEQGANLDQKANLDQNENPEQRDYFLNPTGRYAHSTHYIHQLAKANHLKIELEETIVPRQHEGKAIDGRLFVLQK